MTARLEALRALKAKVEAGDLDFRDDMALNDNWPAKLSLEKTWQAYHGSLDAAKALHEAVLHERCFAEIHYSKRYEDEARVSINLGPDGWVSGTSKPARAWLLAILAALISMEAGHDS